MTKTPDMKAAVLRGRDALEAAEDKFGHYDRNAYGNASEIAGCIRKQWYQRNVKDQPEQDWGYARRGTHMEKYVVESLVAANIPLRSAGEGQLSIQDDDLMLSCTPDGIVDYGADGGLWVLEIKSIDPRTNTDRLPRDAHVTQNSIGVEMLANHNPLLDVQGGIILYIDASNYNVLHQFETKRNPRILQQMSRRAKRVLKSRSVDGLDREGKTTGDCRYCPFKEQCGVSVSGPINRAGPSRGNRGSNLHSILAHYDDSKRLADMAKAEMDTAKAEIMAEMEQRGVQSLPVGDFTVSLKNVAGRTTYDTKKAIAAGVDLTPYQKQGAPSVRLEVKRSEAA